MNQHIEIVSSTTKGLSSMNRLSRQAALAALSRHYTRVGITIVNDLADLEALVDKRPDLVFLGMHYVPDGDDTIWLADYLDDHGIAYTGSDQPAHELEHHKPLAKQQVAAAGLKTAPFWVVKQGELPTADQLAGAYPLFIKPADHGGGKGIDEASIAHSYDQAAAKVRSIADKYQADSLIESYLPGREFSVAILKGAASDGYAVMPLELVAPTNGRGDRMLSSQVKSSDSEQVFPVNNPLLKASLCRLALEVFTALGARDYGRIDIRLDAAGLPHFLEANLLPSLIDNYGSFPKACRMNIGLDHEAMLVVIAQLGLARRSMAYEFVDEAQTFEAADGYIAVPYAA